MSANGADDVGGRLDDVEFRVGALERKVSRVERLCVELQIENRSSLRVLKEQIDQVLALLQPKATL